MRDVLAGSPPAVEMFVLPTFPLLASAVDLLGASSIAVGARDVAASEDPPPCSIAARACPSEWSWLSRPAPP